MTTASDLSQRYFNVKTRVAQLCQKYGRAPESVTLLAVSKTHSSTAIREIYHCGQRQFAENYAQELIAKAEELQDLDIRWHFIGHLQSNKIKKIAPLIDSLHTLASFDHAKTLARVASDAGKKQMPVFIEVNSGLEPGKSGILLHDAAKLAQEIQTQLPILQVEGLMMIPPAEFTDETWNGEAPKLFRDLAAVAKNIGRGQLSLGMSGDLEMAIAAGATHVRIGTGIFGERQT